MQFDPNNKVIQLCGKGIQMEAQDLNEARQLYMQAWDAADNDFEKFTAAHYVARSMPSVSEKLEWDKTALSFALQIDDKAVTGSFPSLYLNIARCYEDLGDMPNARLHYDTALSYAHVLPDDGYGRMIRSGIEQGLERMTQ